MYINPQISRGFLTERQIHIMEFSAKQIASFIEGEVYGDRNATVNTFAKIEEATPGSITFLANPKYTHYIYNTKATIVLVSKEFEPEDNIQSTLIRVDDVYDSLAKLLALYEQQKPKPKGIDPLASVAQSAQIGKDVYIAPFACIAEDAVIGDNTQIYPHCYIGRGSIIGNDTVIYANVSIYHNCQVGDNCTIHSGAVIGSDGFGFAPTATGYDKIPQIGIVVIEDRVEIGANTCIDRATMGETRIHSGVKLDNLIQIAHNGIVGSHTVMAAQVGIAGSTKVGEWCMLGGQVGLAGHIKIGDRVGIGAQAGVPGNVKSGEQILGTPAFDVKGFYKSSAVFKQLPDMFREINQLRRELNELKNKTK